MRKSPQVPVFIYLNIKKEHTSRVVLVYFMHKLKVVCFLLLILKHNSCFKFIYTVFQSQWWYFSMQYDNIIETIIQIPLRFSHPWPALLWEHVCMSNKYSWWSHASNRPRLALLSLSSGSLAQKPNMNQISLRGSGEYKKRAFIFAHRSTVYFCPEVTPEQPEQHLRGSWTTLMSPRCNISLENQAWKCSSEELF